MLDLSPVDTSSSKQGVLGENVLKDTPRKRGLRYKADQSSDQEVKIINLGGLEVASVVRKRSRMERSIMLTKIVIRSGKKSSDNCCLQQRMETSPAKPPATAHVVKKKTEEARKVLKDKP